MKHQTLVVLDFGSQFTQLIARRLRELSVYCEILPFDTSHDAIALRGLFLINPKGKVAYSVVHDLAVGRSVEETLRVLKAFQQVEKTGEVCPANWSEGKKTMKADPVKSKEYFAAA